MTIRSLVLVPSLLTLGLCTGLICSATTSTATSQAKKTKKSRKKLPPKTMTGKVVSTTSPSFTGKMAPASKTFRPTVRRRRVYSEWDEPTYADSTLGDNVDGEDLAVRRAAVEALGPLNGAIVVTDPDSGRILAM